MVMVVSGRTLPLLSVTVPVMPPRVCWARAGRERVQRETARKNVPSFKIFANIFFAIAGTSSGFVKNTNRQQPYDRRLRGVTLYSWSRSWLDPHCPGWKTDAVNVREAGRKWKMGTNDNSFGGN